MKNEKYLKKAWGKMVLNSCYGFPPTPVIPMEYNGDKALEITEESKNSLVTAINKTKNKNLNITISGETASGKSRLTYLLKKFLRENGFEVEQEPNIDYGTEEEFNNIMSKNIDTVIDKIKETTNITIREIQVLSEPQV